MIETPPNEVVFVLGTGTIIALLTAAVMYLRQIVQEIKRIADQGDSHGR